MSYGKIKFRLYRIKKCCDDLLFWKANQSPHHILHQNLTQSIIDEDLKELNKLLGDKNPSIQDISKSKNIASFALKLFKQSGGENE